MDHLEMVEMLRDRANVSYEEAKAVLEETNWELLDAIAAMEKAGKTESPVPQNSNPGFELQEQIVDANETAQETPAEEHLVEEHMAEEQQVEEKHTEEQSVKEQQAEILIEEKQSRKTRKHTFGKGIRHFFGVCCDNALNITHKGKTIFQLPLIAAIIILLFTWKFMLPVVIISLFFGVRYTFSGKDELQEANHFMNTASSVAENIREGFRNGGKTAEQ